MSLRDHLLPDEEVRARVGSFLATNRRILRYEEALDGKETATELSYMRVRGIEKVRPPNHRIMTGGTLLAVGGFLISMIVGLYTPLLLVPAGVGMILFGARGRDAFYQLQTSGATPADEARWRVPYNGSMQFIAEVCDRTGRRPNE